MDFIKKYKNLFAVYDTIKTYKHKSVFFRFWFLIVMALIAVFITVFLVVNNYNSTRHYNNIAMVFSKNMTNIQSSLDKIFTEVLSETKNLAETNIVYDMEYRDKFELKKSDELEAYLQDVISDMEFVKSIYLYYPKSDYIVSSSMIYKSSYINGFADSGWYDIFFDGSSEIFLRDYPESSSSKKGITVCKKISGTEIIAVFNINYDKFNTIRNNNVLMDCELNMINDTGSVIYSTDASKIGADINSYNELRDTYSMSLSNYAVNIKMTNSTLYESIRTKSFNVSIVAGVEKENMDAMSNNKNSIIFISVISLLVLLALSVVLATKFYGSIAGFVDTISSDDKSKIDKNIDEITDISQHITNIINKKYETESELAESLMQLQKAQSIALQSQFSPHFLFNTLQMVNSIAISELNGDSDITTAVNLLCDILHVAMDTTEYTCKLKDEVELAKKYITLQNMKYENAFDVNFDIDEDTLNVTVAKLFLQPLLENSMHHGFDTRRQKMNINIRSYISTNKLVVSVEDDGLGMSEERKNEVIQNLDNKQLEKKNSIGLLNLHQRIKLIFGYEYGCAIDNNEKGVTVNVFFPYR